MPESIYIEVDDNANCEYMPLMLYEAHADAVPVSQIVIDEPGRPPGIYQVTGWSSEGDGAPCPAMYAPVSDSGQAVVHLVFGGDWGIRMKPAESSADWDINPRPVRRTLPHANGRKRNRPRRYILTI